MKNLSLMSLREKYNEAWQSKLFTLHHPESTDLSKCFQQRFLPENKQVISEL
jgi:hypothetical protein